MLHNFTKTSVWTLAARLACTPFVFAAGQSGKPASGATSATGQHSQQQQGQGASTRLRPLAK
jgi:hypothetical protein